MGSDRNLAFSLHEDRVSIVVRNLVCDNKKSDETDGLEYCSQADARDINRSCGILHICRSLEHYSLDLELFAFWYSVTLCISRVEPSSHTERNKQFETSCKSFIVIGENISLRCAR